MKKPGQEMKKSVGSSANCIPLGPAADRRGYHRERSSGHAAGGYDGPAGVVESDDKARKDSAGYRSGSTRLVLSRAAWNHYMALTRKFAPADTRREGQRDWPR